MAKFMIAALAFAAFVISPAFAQKGDSRMFDELYRSLGKQQKYSVERRGADEIALRSSGTELCRVRMEGAGLMTISGKVGKAAPELKSQLLRKLAVANFSLAVGTLMFDEPTGLVTMEHSLNPQVLGVERMAGTVLMFGETLERTSRQLSRLIAPATVTVGR